MWFPNRARMDDVSGLPVVDTIQYAPNSDDGIFPALQIDCFGFSYAGLEYCLCLDIFKRFKKPGD